MHAPPQERSPILAPIPRNVLEESITGFRIVSPIGVVIAERGENRHTWQGLRNHVANKAYGAAGEPPISFVATADAAPIVPVKPVGKQVARQDHVIVVEAIPCGRCDHLIERRPEQRIIRITAKLRND